MKTLLSLVVTILIITVGPLVPANAFYLQESIELSYPNYNSPYPQVISPAIDILPSDAVTISSGNETFYYSDGVFYQRIMRDQKYVIVPPPIGAVIFNMPQGYEYLYLNGIAYYVYKGIYYKRVLEGYRVIYPLV